MKICVYAISKNEETFVKRWMASMSEADLIVVMDTGSTDHTVDLLRECGAMVVSKTVTPWRFDNARNQSLALVPDDVDVCVCTDLDEVFDPGWRAILETHWPAGPHQGKYRYTWSFNEDGSEGAVFWRDKIHTRHDFIWVHPVHEILKPIDPEKYAAVYLPEIQLNHYPDPTKPRSQYLPLLELSVQEDPLDDRNLHYLGREYMYYGQWEKSIVTLERHLNLPTATWTDERCASMRFIAFALQNLNDMESAENWLYRAIAEAPHLREPYIDLALLFYQQKNWCGVLLMSEKALLITQRSMTYINEPRAWGETPYDLASLACANLGFYEKAYYYINEAIKLAPQDQRLEQNRLFIKENLFK